MTTPAVESFVSEFARHAASLPGARVPWIAKLRRDALERFAQQDLPTNRDEDWKYTSVGAIAKRVFAVAPPSAAADGVDADSVASVSENAHRLVFVDGRYAPSLSRIGPLPAGVTLRSLAETLERAPERLAPFLGVDRYQTIFAALNTAFAVDGVHLDLPRGAVVSEPIHAVFLSTLPDVAVQPRNVIVAGDDAHATIVEHYVGRDGAATFTNALTQVFAGANARLAHYKVQQEGLRALHLAGIHASQARGSRLESHSIALGALLSRNDITTSFDAEGCEAELNGLFLASGRQHVDHHTRIDHAKPHGTSREHYKGVLNGASRGVFNGKVIVHPGAQKSNAHLANHNLLLARTAEIDTKPELRIDADDVKCAHGATVGQLDMEALFYLRTRGVDEALARSLLTYAFANDVIERIRLPSLHRGLEQVLLNRLPQGTEIRELR
jgi:Fe-S cluster assembly protein SufD